MNSNRSLKELMDTYLSAEATEVYDRSVKRYRRKVVARSYSMLGAAALCAALVTLLSPSKIQDGSYFFANHSVKEAEEILAEFFNDGPDVEESLCKFINSASK